MVYRDEPRKTRVEEIGRPNMRLHVVERVTTRIPGSGVRVPYVLGERRLEEVWSTLAKQATELTPATGH